MLQPQRIESDRKCMGCGYNLKGLEVDGQCPECAFPIRAPSTIDDPISRMPADVINGFRRGGWLGTNCLLLVMAVVVLARLGEGMRPLSWAVLMLAAAGWIVATWMLTPKLYLPAAIRHGFAENGRLRHFARGLQVVWPPFVAVQFAFGTWTMTGGVNTALEAVASVLTFVGVVAIVVMGVMLQRLAVWTRDDLAEKAFVVVIWGFPIVMALQLLDTTSIAGRVGRLLPINVLISAIMLAGFIALPFGLLTLSRSLSYAVIHSQDYDEWQERRAERRRRDDRKLTRTLSKVDSSPPRDDAGDHARPSNRR